MSEKDYSQMSMERLKFERQTLREKVEEARDALRRELDGNEEYLATHDYTSQQHQNCLKIASDYRQYLNEAESELSRCEEVLRGRL